MSVSDPDLILGLESRLINAWPSFDYQIYDGWILRLAKGYSKRANSASPLVAGGAPRRRLVDLMVAQFAAANVRPTFRLTSLEDAGVDDACSRAAASGDRADAVLLAMISDELHRRSRPSLLEPKVATRWVRETARSYGGEKAERCDPHRHRVAHPPARGLRHPRLDDRHVAWGLGVVERGYVGLYDIVVAPELRGIGLGRRIVTSLMAWGRRKGAHTAYLQVREDNEVARALYGRSASRRLSLHPPGHAGRRRSA